MKLAVIVTVTVLVLASTAAAESLFRQWQGRQSRRYSSPEEETLRAAIFARNVEKINAHNLKDEGWTMAINEFADLTAEEFYAARVSGYMPASRRVQRLGVPANDNLANAATVSGTSASGTTTDATAETQEPSALPGQPATKSVWFTWSAAASGTVTADTHGSGFDTVMAAYTRAAGTTGFVGLTQVGHDDDCFPNTAVMTSCMSWSVTAGSTYLIQVDGFGGAAGLVSLHVAAPVITPANDNFANRVSVTTGVPVTGSSVLATHETYERSIAYKASASVWYDWSATSTGVLTLTTLGSDFDTAVALYSYSSASTALTGLALLKSNDDCAAPSVTSCLSANVTAGMRYAIQVDGYDSSSGSIELLLTFVASGDRTATTTATPTVTRTVTSTATASPSKQLLRSVTASPTVSATVSGSPSAGNPNSRTPTTSRTPSKTVTKSRTPSKTVTKSRSVSRSVSKTRSASATPAGIPAGSVDWTAAGAVTRVKDQGSCGSCWAFSVTGAIESGNFLLGTRTLTSLSEQQLVDCAGSAGNYGCNGGYMQSTFNWVASQGGLCSEAAYPYTAVDGTCRSSSCSKVTTVRGFAEVPWNNDGALATAVSRQPVSVAVEASSDFQFYSSGVFKGVCGSNLDHAVLVVGYGVSGSDQYWKVKNSWGTWWGDQGYIKIHRGGSYNGGAGQCGILADPSYPTF